MMLWVEEEAVIWKLIESNLSSLNEEGGEIILSMLSSAMFKSQKGDVDKISEKFKETSLRFGMEKVVCII